MEICCMRKGMVQCHIHGEVYYGVSSVEMWSDLESWQLGKINIWRDPWIPRGSTRAVITPKGSNILSKVDEEMLKQTFWEDDVEMIRSTLVHTDMDDVLAWHVDTRGILSVKSAYKVYREHLLSTSRRGMASPATNGRQEDSF
jgi:hypothetical protein